MRPFQPHIHIPEDEKEKGNYVHGYLLMDQQAKGGNIAVFFVGITNACLI